MSIETINQKAVKTSIVAGFIIAIIGIIVGISISSQAILFAAITSLIGSIITFIPLVTLKFIRRRNSQKYPFGKEILEPLIAITQYFPLFIICVYNIISSIQVIISGGNLVEITSGVVYGIFVSFYKICICVYLICLTKKYKSPIAEAEAMGWKFESAIGTGILLGFSIAWLLNEVSMASLIPYVDPLLTLFIFIFLIIATTLAFIDCLRQLMWQYPSNDIAQAILDKIEKVDNNHEFLDKVLRLGRVGSKVIVEIDYIISPDSKLAAVVEQDKIRYQFISILTKQPYNVWLNISFMNDIKLSEKTLLK